MNEPRETRALFTRRTLTSFFHFADFERRASYFTFSKREQPSLICCPLWRRNLRLELGRLPSLNVSTLPRAESCSKFRFLFWKTDLWDWTWDKWQISISPRVSENFNVVESTDSDKLTRKTAGRETVDEKCSADKNRSEDCNYARARDI